MWFEHLGWPDALRGLWRGALGVLAAFLLILCLAGLMSASAWPRVHAGPGVMDGGRRLGGSVAAPLDGFTQPSAAYSFRKLRTAYAGSAVKLRRTTGGVQDIGFTAAGDFDTAAAATFCLATTCFIDTAYDQSGNARHVTQGVAADQPEYIAACNGDKPCSRSALTFSRYLILGGITAASPLSLNSVAKQTARSSTGCREVWYGAGNELNQQPLIDALSLSNGVGSFSAVSTGLAWHSHTGVMNGASSVINVDGVETTGTLTATLTAGNIVVNYNGAVGATCDVSEAVAWSGYALTAGERTALAENQRNYWTPLPLDTFQTPAAAYSLRRLKSSYTGPAIRLRRASDNAEQDINFLGFTSFTGAPLDTAAANAHCAATTCYLRTWYDQSGVANNFSQPGAADQPTFVFNCLGTLPCLRMDSSDYLQSAAAVSVVSPLSLNVVGQHKTRATPGGGNACKYIWAQNNALQQHPDLDILFLTNGGSTINLAAPYAVWHSATGVINAAATVGRVDATETTGTLAAATGSNSLYTQGAPGGAVCEETEIILWNGYALTAGERAALQTNQKSFWGLP